MGASGGEVIGCLTSTLGQRRKLSRAEEPQTHGQRQPGLVCWDAGAKQEGAPTHLLADKAQPYTPDAPSVVSCEVPQEHSKQAPNRAPIAFPLAPHLAPLFRAVGATPTQNTTRTGAVVPFALAPPLGIDSLRDCPRTIDEGPQ